MTEYTNSACQTSSMSPIVQSLRPPFTTNRRRAPQTYEPDFPISPWTRWQCPWHQNTLWSCHEVILAAHRRLQQGFRLHTPPKRGPFIGPLRHRTDRSSPHQGSPPSKRRERSSGSREAQPVTTPAGERCRSVTMNPTRRKSYPGATPVSPRRRVHRPNSAPGRRSPSY